MKRELKRELMYEYRCDGRLKTKNEESTRLADTNYRFGVTFLFFAFFIAQTNKEQLHYDVRTRQEPREPIPQRQPFSAEVGRKV
jgi:hypothetical protein